MESLVAPIPLESQRLALENVQDDAKRPAPLVGGCRIEGFVRVKKVKFHLEVCHIFLSRNIVLSYAFMPIFINWDYTRDCSSYSAGSW